MTQCSPRLTAVASSSQGLLQGGSCSRELSSLRALKALNISIATNTDRDNVLALVRPEHTQVHTGIHKNTHADTTRCGHITQKQQA